LGRTCFLKGDGFIACSPQVLEDNEFDVIVVASKYYQDIMIQLEKNGINNFILTPISPEDIMHPNFTLYLEYSKKAYEFYKKVYTVQKKIDTLSISDYNKKYFVDKTLGHIYLYGEILWNVFKYHGEPETLLDYGGGTGLLGMYAKYLGINNVYYNDIDDISCKDAKVIAKELNIDLEDYICGDLDNVINYSILNNRYFDAIISNDVIEHIYDVDEYFKKLPRVCKRDCFISMWTGANSYNPKIVQLIEAKHYQGEYLDSQDVKGWENKESDPLNANGIKPLIDFDALSKRIRSFENIFIFPENNKATADVISLCLQDKAYPYVLEEWLDEQEEYLYRYRMYYQILIKWLKKMTLGHKVGNWLEKKGIHKIIIYGGGELGQILYEQLQTDSKVVVEAICDQNTSRSAQYFRNSRVISVDELIQKYNHNTIIVTPVYAYDAIYKDISKKVKGNIIDLGMIIEEM